MENQNSTTSNSEKVDYAIQEEEIENEEGQQNGKTLSRGQKKKLKKKLQKEKGAQGEPSEIDNLASKVNEVQINEAKPSNSTEESKQDSKTGQNSDSQNKDDANADSNKDKGSEDKEPELTPEEQFKKELAWCIRQITLGLENNKVTRDQRKLTLLS